MAQSSDYPVQYSIDYSEQRNRLTTLFRIILSIPINILWQLLSFASGAIFLPVVLMLLFRAKYPRWWFDFILEMRRFQTRINAYNGLLTDDYPSTDERQAVHLDVEYPDNLNRFLPLVKWLLVIPHYIVLIVLLIVWMFVTIIAWFAILFTGSYPRSLFDFSVGLGRWFARVDAYAWMLATDRYPPFRLSP